MDVRIDSDGEYIVVGVDFAEKFPGIVPTITGTNPMLYRWEFPADPVEFVIEVELYGNVHVRGASDSASYHAAIEDLGQDFYGGPRLGVTALRQEFLGACRALDL